mmetsp:Transcript_30401/g.75529  ORF Transcript_30401/g.75529 Transcript_30401/m.75529 type:complete len:276 (-) Transcript_30401:1527-2354(-)
MLPNSGSFGKLGISGSFHGVGARQEELSPLLHGISPLGQEGSVGGKLGSEMSTFGNLGSVGIVGNFGLVKLRLSDGFLNPPGMLKSTSNPLTLRLGKLRFLGRPGMLKSGISNDGRVKSGKSMSGKSPTSILNLKDHVMPSKVGRIFHGNGLMVGRCGPHWPSLSPNSFCDSMHSGRSIRDMSGSGGNPLMLPEKLPSLNSRTLSGSQSQSSGHGMGPGPGSIPMWMSNTGPVKSGIATLAGHAILRLPGMSGILITVVNLSWSTTDTTMKSTHG